MNRAQFAPTPTTEISNAFIPQILLQAGGKFRDNVLMILAGVIALGLLASIRVPLESTPIPVTGQTFGVVVIALLFGRKRAVAIFSSYLVLGIFGAPVFAFTKLGLGASFGPTSGYLAGMLFASFTVGSLADRGWTKTFIGTFAAALIGSVCIFSIGLAVLATYVPSSGLLAWGLTPFLPVDAFKMLLAAVLVWPITRRRDKAAERSVAMTEQVRA
jgi:biotin transport system substrate-specific component